MKSKQKKAIEFQEWITDVVLPQLREKGSFALENKIGDLEEKLRKSMKTNKNMKLEIDYLRGNKYILNGNNIMYIIKIITTIKGKKKICYKLGITDDIHIRLNTYRTGNPNVKLLSYFKIDNIDAKMVEDCAISLLKYKSLKKNNEIFCTSLKNIYELLQSCLSHGENLMGVCNSCKQKINIKIVIILIKNQVENNQVENNQVENNQVEKNQLKNKNNLDITLF